jgi:hypothetical protein
MTTCSGSGRYEQIDDPIRIEEDLSDVIAICLGHAASDSRVIGQSFDRSDEALSELPRVVGRVPRNVLADVDQIPMRVLGPI